MTNRLYGMSDRNSDAKYPSWKDAPPNLQTFLTAINLSQPILQCQYELVWSRWPRTMFFAKNITIPGVSVNTIDINHAGFSIPIPTHVNYENTEVSMTIVADKEGFHYYDLRNMVLQTGHPLVAGDPRATIGNNYNISPTEDIIEVRLRNQPSDGAHHHWILHNFHPTGIGEIELRHDSGSFVEFELTGTITHVTYDCGQSIPEQTESPPSEEQMAEESDIEPRFGELDDNGNYVDEQEQPEPEEDEEDYEDYRYIDDSEPPTEPMPDEPQETQKENVIMSGNESVVYGENGEMTISSTSQIGIPNSASETDQIEAMACDMRLNDAAKEFTQAIEEISKMPADPNYPPENVSSEEDTFNIVTANDGIKAMGGVSVETSIKSAEQKTAYDAAVEKYNQRAGNALNDYKNYRDTGKL